MADKAMEDKVMEVMEENNNSTRVELKIGIARIKKIKKMIGQPLRSYTTTKENSQDWDAEGDLCHRQKKEAKLMEIRELMEELGSTLENQL